MGILANFFISLACCALLYVVGLIWIRLRTPAWLEYNPAYLTWLKWNLILCPLITWPAFGILLGVLFPDPNGGLLGGLL